MDNNSPSKPSELPLVKILYLDAYRPLCGEYPENQPDSTQDDWDQAYPKLETLVQNVLWINDFRKKVGWPPLNREADWRAYAYEREQGGVAVVWYNEDNEMAVPNDRIGCGYCHIMIWLNNVPEEIHRRVQRKLEPYFKIAFARELAMPGSVLYNIFVNDG